ncbi:MAG: site-specific integrase [Bacteroidia bacterium]|nr:site-specific integrase [Bacteroidia bacterium]
MDKQIKDFNELISNAADYLESQLSYSIRTVYEYRKSWKRIRTFMALNGIKCYSHDVGEQILHHEFKDRRKAELSTNEKHFFNSIVMLTEFQELGQIKVPTCQHKEPITFSGPIGDIITGFLDYKRTEERLSIIRIHCYQLNLFRFLNYCNKKGICSIKDINLAVILLFIGELDLRKKIPVSSVISALRGFMKYAFEQKLLATDYSNKIPKYKSVIQPKLPSTYSKEEIEKLISSVERSSSIGKRNYAIILIASRLGLRASDISKLKFENLHWNTCTIEIMQFKTGKELVLPLLPDVGNAIIDYLKYGRPKSEEPYVLLTERPPFGHFPTSNVVTHVVQRAFIEAGIDIKGRRFGPHSLRHSLGFRMLEQSTVLPVIAEVLGHENTESTRYYLRIDLKSMRQCMLDVPPVPTDFYEQKGGAFFYE